MILIIKKLLTVHATTINYNNFLYNYDVIWHKTNIGNLKSDLIVDLDLSLKVLLLMIKLKYEISTCIYCVFYVNHKKLTF